jgi:hypothetical protein
MKVSGVLAASTSIAINIHVGYFTGEHYNDVGQRMRTRNIRYCYFRNINV